MLNVNICTRYNLDWNTINLKQRVLRKHSLQGANNSLGSAEAIITSYTYTTRLTPLTHKKNSIIKNINSKHWLDQTFLHNYAVRGDISKPPNMHSTSSRNLKWPNTTSLVVQTIKLLDETSMAKATFTY